jgi:hypothetical protein
MSAQQQKHKRPEKQHRAMMRMRIKSHRERPSGRKLSSSLLSLSTLPSLLSPPDCSIRFRESSPSLSRPPRTIAAGPVCCFLSSVVRVVVVVVEVEDDVATAFLAPEFSLCKPVALSTVAPEQLQKSRENTTATRKKDDGWKRRMLMTCCCCVKIRGMGRRLRLLSLVGKQE